MEYGWIRDPSEWAVQRKEIEQGCWWSLRWNDCAQMEGQRKFLPIKYGFQKLNYSHSLYPINKLLQKSHVSSVHLENDPLHPQA